jgi:hypothetical protein
MMRLGTEVTCFFAQSVGSYQMFESSPRALIGGMLVAAIPLALAVVRCGDILLKGADPRECEREFIRQSEGEVAPLA